MHQPEQQSTIERRIATDAVRQNRVVVLGVSPRPVPSEADRAKSQAESRARALPDEEFAVDPDVQALQFTLAARQAVAADRLGARAWLRTERERLAAQIDAADKELAWDVLCDAVGRDGGFVLARQALAGLESDRALIAAIDAALRKLDSQSGASIGDGVADARTALQNYLFEMKVAHVKAGQEQKDGVAA